MKKASVDLTTGLVYNLDMTQVNVQQAKTQLSKLLGLVEAGEVVVISRYGKPVAKLVHIDPPTANRTPGTWKDAIQLAEDFDDEMPEEWMEDLEP